MPNLRQRVIIILSVIITFLPIALKEVVGGNIDNPQASRPRVLMFVPNAPLLVSDGAVGLTGNLRFWSSKDGQIQDTVELKEGVWVKSMAVSHDGNFLVTALSGDNVIGCYSIKEKIWLWTAKWTGKVRYRYSIAFTPDDAGVVVQGYDKIITYDTKKGTILKQLSDVKGFSDGYPRSITSFSALSPSARFSVIWQGNFEHDETLSWNPKVWAIVWDIQNKEIIGRQEKMQVQYKNCSSVFSPDEKNILFGSMNGFIREWSISEQRTISEWKVYGTGAPIPQGKQYVSPASIETMIFSPNGKYLSIVGFEPAQGFVLRVYEYKMRKLIREFSNVTQSKTLCSGYSMAYSLDSKHFAFDNNGKLCLYNTQTWKEQWCI